MLENLKQPLHGCLRNLDGFLVVRERTRRIHWKVEEVCANGSELVTATERSFKVLQE